MGEDSRYAVIALRNHATDDWFGDRPPRETFRGRRFSFALQLLLTLSYRSFGKNLKPTTIGYFGDFGLFATKGSAANHASPGDTLLLDNPNSPETGEFGFRPDHYVFGTLGLFRAAV